MRILIAEDDRVSRQLLIDHLKGWKHEVVAVADGRAALDVVQEDEPFDMAILDWMMPHRSGIDVCEAIKKSTANKFTYVIMLTAKEKTADLAEAFKRGTDDFVKKPFDPVELKARVLAGERIALLQSTLSKKVTELQDALTHVKQLQKILPICAWCKKVRDDTDYWHNVEDYVAANSETEFSHGICPECAAEHYPDVPDDSDKAGSVDGVIVTD